MSEAQPGAWTTTSLLAALSGPDYAEEFQVERLDGSDPVLVVRMIEHGDLSILLNVGEEQIVAATLLWPVDEQPDAAAFNIFILKAQKLVPLSNFAITEVGGRDYYELMGELSTESRLSTIVLELKVLAENAISAAGELREAFAAA
ncbi:YjfI family protein [Sphingobium sufflavum]|uniref:YjfI family protein n=1 Tax=Sphingobium sufflavum TaxID=1129547 RepID=UPI001F34CC53|nr:DUF2170 family protein [Sphingobium sufflavum]MCE7796193.1 YjfI family protein [Sphingobium sufflavum]